jgi:hypothetical protein
LLVAVAAGLSACGGEDEPTTPARVPDAQDVADADSVAPEAVPSDKARDGGGDRSEKARGDEARGPTDARERAPRGGDVSRPSGGNRGNGGAGAQTPESSTAEQQLEDAVQELIQGGDTEPSGERDSGIRVPSRLLDPGGGEQGLSLEDICLDPDECPGVREGPG